jgi:hypothetical protein
MNLKSKLVIDPQTFLSDEEKVYYVFDRFTGTAARCTTLWVCTNQDSEPLRLSDFFTGTDIAFDDSHRKKKALVRVNS